MAATDSDGPGPGDGPDGEDHRHQRDPAEEARRKVCALFDTAREAGDARGLRDAALISLLYGAGFPRRLGLRLPLAAYDPATGLLTPPDRGNGRSRRRRAVAGARETLADWLRLRGEWPGPLLCRVDGEGGIVREAVPAAQVDRILARLATEAGVREVSPAAFRRLYRSPWWEDPDPA